MPKHWPDHLPVVQMRIARPTGQFERVVAFYRDGLGLPIIYSYLDDADYDGVIFGLPGRTLNLEITRHHGDGPCPIPPPDNLLVLYILDRPAIDELVAHLGTMGYVPIAPRNSYWAEHGVTIPDPDGWNVVLMNTPGFAHADE
jgi:catechol 2,3-dioxygenase-like lactoylglutathione lyase family enzyme